MPRSRGGRSSGPAPRTQTRSSSTAAPSHPQQHQQHHPPPQAAPPMQQQGSQPGLFSQMASTAAGVAVGSAVGHTLANGVSSIFGGGSSAPAEQQQTAAPQQQETQQARCDVDARNLTRCLDENGGNMQICDWYLQQLKACQQAASNY
ncbi:hypothetical protein TRICI_005203 [Trichomonascus ciferrii]|uniref:CHCH domain-containing protein n=1 Tax=Trichomonascus ciferrii TaxID=44093 RepID=A0A642UUZ2_9ASCO|nr:hypothetical protein TRICI_005203 [Trichomonascus ciferrii]